ncbi:MAG: DUF3579 domain-containing protein [Burkholderiaceae bacterium]
MSDVPPSNNNLRQFFVHGMTLEGRPFRPSDWAERLAGVLSCYRPGGMVSGRDAFIGYSPFVRPMVIDGVKCVLLDERLRDVERMAFDFVINFARDNGLTVYASQVREDGSAGPDFARPRAE